MASHARPQRLLYVTVGFQRTHETSPRCGGTTVPPCNHSGCPTTPSKAILKHMTTPYGTLYQITNFPREQNSLILNRPLFITIYRKNHGIGTAIVTDSVTALESP